MGPDLDFLSSGKFCRPMEVAMKILFLVLAIYLVGFGQWGCSGSFSWGDGASSQSGTRIQTVDGRVERVDLQRNSFEMRDQSGEGSSFAPRRRTEVGYRSFTGPSSGRLRQSRGKIPRSRTLRVGQFSSGQPLAGLPWA